jgi:hypothetical protein
MHDSKIEKTKVLSKLAFAERVIPSPLRLKQIFYQKGKIQLEVEFINTFLSLAGG